MPFLAAVRCPSCPRHRPGRHRRRRRTAHAHPAAPGPPHRPGRPAHRRRLFLALCDQQPAESVTERHRRIFGHDGPVFIACGGAPVPPEILQRLHAHGLTVHEGYGLSENSSVVSWNFPGEVRFGTVGRPLDHVHAELADDGELLIRSTSLFA
ncbi:AMP-binding protein [Streptomyces kaempferi]